MFENGWKLTDQEGQLIFLKETDEGINSFYLYDEYDSQNNILSMARTTGYTCCAAVHLMANGMYNKKHNKHKGFRCFLFFKSLD